MLAMRGQTCSLKKGQTMHNHTRKIRLAAMALLLGFVISLVGSAAKAADAVRIAHDAIRSKILREAGDRYDVRFLTTHSDRISPHERKITGTGRFRRQGKTAQKFTYHSTVDIHNDSDVDTGYNLQ